ncbi:hypothetical protein WN51_14669 [Melipona quadrifasciata]|uniref:Uncharacterized protein n=1 Tax=Melipona quadrifasciata TaxID=166423 RepID=A0A0N0BFD8_9HYME|nr:hypothetical protein WN51_14669 [Melipona quadrifasciata]
MQNYWGIVPAVDIFNRNLCYFGLSLNTVILLTTKSLKSREEEFSERNSEIVVFHRGLVGVTMGKKKVAEGACSLKSTISWLYIDCSKFTVRWQSPLMWQMNGSYADEKRKKLIIFKVYVFYVPILGDGNVKSNSLK